MKINVVDKIIIEADKSEITPEILNKILDHTLNIPVDYGRKEVETIETPNNNEELLSKITDLEAELIKKDEEIQKRDDKYQKLLSTLSVKKEEKVVEKIVLEKRPLKKINYTQCLSPMTVSVSNYTLINCCSHDITVVDDSGKTIIIPPSGINSRIASELTEGVNLFGLKLKTPDMEAEAIDIPEERPRTFYIVSSFVYDSLPNRIDFLCPYAMGKNTVRDKVTGEVLGVRGLVARTELIEKLKLELK